VDGMERAGRNTTTAEGGRAKAKREPELAGQRRLAARHQRDDMLLFLGAKRFLNFELARTQRNTHRSTKIWYQSVIHPIPSFTWSGRRPPLITRRRREAARCGARICVRISVLLERQFDYTPARFGPPQTPRARHPRMPRFSRARTLTSANLIPALAAKRLLGAYK
jgi:hypothetical protein